MQDTPRRSELKKLLHFRDIDAFNPYVKERDTYRRVIAASNRRVGEFGCEAERPPPMRSRRPVAKPGAGRKWDRNRDLGELSESLSNEYKMIPLNQRVIFDPSAMRVSSIRPFYTGLPEGHFGCGHITLFG
jgi:hypothetical protein